MYKEGDKVYYEFMHDPEINGSGVVKGIYNAEGDMLEYIIEDMLALENGETDYSCFVCDANELKDLH